MASFVDRDVAIAVAIPGGFCLMMGIDAHNNQKPDSIYLILLGVAILLILLVDLIRGRWFS